MKIPKKIHEFRLNNGFKLIVKEDHRSPIAIFQLFYKIGSSYEHHGITGVSHALEHMMFRGTHKYDANKFIHQISELGGHQNAHTGHDFTSYYELLPAIYIEDCFRFEADRMRNLLLDKKHFAKEIKVVMEERRLIVDDQPVNITYERFYATSYLFSSYRHPIIGWMNDLENMTIKDLSDWYKRWYAPNNAFAVVVGDVVPKNMFQLAKKYFGNLKVSNIPSLKPQEEVKSLGLRTVVAKAPSETPLMIFGFHTPVIATAKDKWEPLALLLICELLAGDRSSRLQKYLVREKQLLMDANYRYSPFNRMCNVMSISVTPIDKDKLIEVKENVMTEIVKLQKKLVPNKELQLIKTQIIANRVYEADSIEYQAAEIGMLEIVDISWKEIESIYDKLEKITPKQLHTVACKYLTEDNLTLGTLEPLPLKEKNTIKSKQKLRHTFL